MSKDSFMSQENLCLEVVVFATFLIRRFLVFIIFVFINGELRDTKSLFTCIYSVSALHRFRLLADDITTGKSQYHYSCFQKHTNKQSIIDDQGPYQSGDRLAERLKSRLLSSQVATGTPPRSTKVQEFCLNRPPIFRDSF